MFLRFKISSIMAFAAVFAFANAMQGCSLAQPEKKLLRIEIPARADFAAKASASYSLKYADPLAFLLPRGTGALMAPGNISLFNCFALNVTGPDIPVDNRMQCKDAVDVVGIAGGTVPASGGIVEVMVPSGSNRKLELMGFDGTGTDCLPMGQVFDAVAAELNGGPSADPLTEPLGKPWLLAETVVDIVGDTTITMDVSQNTASARELFQSCGVQEPSPSPSPSPSASPSPSPTPTPTPLNVVISLSGSQPSNTAILPVEFTVSFSQVINTTTFDESDITQSGTATGVAWSLSIIDQMTYTLRATAVGTQGTIIPTIPASVVWDTSSNPNEASTGSATVAFDNVGPAAPGFVSATPASPSSNLNPLINGTSSSDTEYLRFYSEAACANEIGSGSKALFESTGITITLQPNQATSLYAVAFDSLSNASACTSMSAYTHDNTAPTVTITTSASSPTALSPIPVTVTFSEVVTGFGSGGVTVTNGSVGSFLGSGATYTFDLIPAANGFVTVDLAPGEAMDAAGNANSAAAQFSIQYTVDNIAPSFPVLTAPVADQVVPPGALKVKGGCETGATVTLSGVGTTVYATCIDSVFEATVDVTPGNGVRSLLVHQTDPAGNDSSSTSVSFNCLTSLVTIPQGLPGYSALPDNTVTAIYRDTTTVPPTLYVGTPGGLAISTDDGVSFSTRTTADGLGNNGVLGVVALGNQVFVATSNGLAVSNDNGVTFTKRMVGEYVRDVALQGSTLYVGTQYSGLKTTTDGGITFTQKTWSGSTSTINTVRVFGTTVLVGTSGGLGISVDNGASFVQRTFSGSNNVVSVYTSGVYYYAATSDGLAVSTNSGASFSKTALSGLLSTNITSVAGYGSYLYVGTDYGIGYTTLGNTVFTNKNMSNGLANDFVRKVITSDSLVIAGTDKGLSISTDPILSSFTNYFAAHALGSSDVFAVAGDATNLFVATSKGLVSSATGGLNFVNKIDSVDIRDVFASASEVYVSDYGKVWIAPISTGAFAEFNFSTHSLDDQAISVSASGSDLYVATSSDLIYSNDDGATVTYLMTSASFFSAFNIRSIESGVFGLFVSTSGGLFVSNDSGSNWSNRTTAAGLGSNSVNRVIVRDAIMYAATDGGLSISENGGVSFTNRSSANGLNAPVRDVVVLNKTIFVATAGGGIGISTDGGENFVMRTVADGLGSNYVRRLHVIGSSVYATTANGLSKFSP